MSTVLLKVLLVDDEPKIVKMMCLGLQELPLEIHSFTHSQKAIKTITEQTFDLAFIDLKMSPVNGMVVLDELLKHSPQCSAIIITAHGSVETAVEAIKKGAHDYLQKPFDMVELQLLTQKTLEFHNLKKEVRSLKTQLFEFQGQNKIITKNSKTLEIISLAKRIAPSMLSVLIEGESGTGKELFAHLIQQASDRPDKPFIKVNCAAIPENLLESELFGHVKGSFTGALKDRKGRFELAEGGTIFLDEITELSPALQAKLLRIIQNKEYERLGESITQKSDVRLITATNKNLEEAISEGSFREDLFYRLNQIRLHLEPLRDRLEDIPLLIRYFINENNSSGEMNINADAFRALRIYRWPGNIRELENVVQRALVLARNNTITLADLPLEVHPDTESAGNLLSLRELERSQIIKTLQVAKDLRDAADILGIDQATLWRKRKRYKI